MFFRRIHLMQNLKSISVRKCVCVILKITIMSRCQKLKNPALYHFKSYLGGTISLETIRTTRKTCQ